MPLILSLKEGEDFVVGGESFVIARVTGDRHFVLHHKATDTYYECVMDRMSELMPDVFVSSGDRAGKATARVVIDAPKDIKIRRGA